MWKAQHNNAVYANELDIEGQEFGAELELEGDVCPHITLDDSCSVFGGNLLTGGTESVQAANRENVSQAGPVPDGILAVVGADGGVLYDAPNGSVIENLGTGETLTAVGRSANNQWVVIYTDTDTAGWVDVVAIGAVTRLQDMGIEPFLLSSSLIGVMAQRLVRLLCEDCREQHQATEAESEWLGVDPGSAPMIYRPKGCEKCNFTGYRGRTGIYELIDIDDDLRSMIHEGASEMAMLKVARARAKRMLGDGQRRVLEGQTSMEEVVRVTTAA